MYIVYYLHIQDIDLLVYTSHEIHSYLHMQLTQNSPLLCSYLDIGSIRSYDELWNAFIHIGVIEIVDSLKITVPDLSTPNCGQHNPGGICIVINTLMILTLHEICKPVLLSNLHMLF